MKHVAFFVEGKPATAGSKTMGRAKNGRTFVRPANLNQKPWMQAIAGVARTKYNDDLMTGAISLRICFGILRPKGHYRTGSNAHLYSKKGMENKYHTQKPDLTKMTRAIEDALTGVVWRDDSQVCVQHVNKLWVDRNPGVSIEVEELE